MLSDSRLAARPVGAQSAIATVLASRIFRIELTRVVLPTPGPPVITSTLDTRATRTASRLALGERQLRPLLDPRDGLVGIDRRPGRASDGQRLELLGNLPLGPVEAGEEDAAAAIEIIGDDRAILKLQAERRLDELGRHLEQLLRQGETALRCGRPQCPSSIASVSA